SRNTTPVLGRPQLEDEGVAGRVDDAREATRVLGQHRALAKLEADCLDEPLRRADGVHAADADLVRVPHDVLDERAAVLLPPTGRADRERPQHRGVAVLVEYRDADDDAAVLEDCARPPSARRLEPELRR